MAKTESLDGSTPTTYLIATLDFDSQEALGGAGLSSAEGQAAAADVPNFATGGGVTMLGAELDKQQLG